MIWKMFKSYVVIVKKKNKIRAVEGGQVWCERTVRNWNEKDEIHLVEWFKQNRDRTVSVQEQRNNMQVLVWTQLNVYRMVYSRDLKH